MIFFSSFQEQTDIQIVSSGSNLEKGADVNRKKRIKLKKNRSVHKMM